MSLTCTQASVVIKDGTISGTVGFPNGVAGGSTIQSLTDVPTPVASGDLVNRAYVMASKGPTGAAGAAGSPASTLVITFSTTTLTFSGLSGTASSFTNGSAMTYAKGNGNKFHVAFTGTFASGSGTFCLTTVGTIALSPSTFGAYASPTAENGGTLALTMVVTGQSSNGTTYTHQWTDTSNCSVAGSYNVVLMQE
jgi:hypothetical protein